MLKEWVDEGRLGIRSESGFYEYKVTQAAQAIANRDNNFLELLKLRKQLEK